MICDICGREKDENTVICTNCEPQCDCEGSCGSQTKDKNKDKGIIENIKNKFIRGYSKD